VRLEFCACGSKDGLQHGYLVTKAKGGSDAEANRITLCSRCYDKHEQLLRREQAQQAHQDCIGCQTGARCQQGGLDSEFLSNCWLTWRQSGMHRQGVTDLGKLARIAYGLLLRDVHFGGAANAG
jgi:hypothetical protein